MSQRAPVTKPDRFSTADLFDQAPDRVQVCDLAFRSFGSLKCFAGSCMTLQASDHLAVRALLSAPGAGGILIVDQLPLAPRVAMLGDRLAGLALRNGWSAIVVNGYVRDADMLAGMPLGIVALGTTARRHAAPDGRCARAIPLEIGGAMFRPGDWIVGDSDAIVGCPREVFSGLYGEE